MKFKSLGAALAGAVILSSAPLLASAANSQTGPIHIDNVQVWAPEDTSSAGVALVYPGSVKIAFTNNSNSPATDVVFALLSNGSVATRINDVGSFANGVTISHEFANENASIQDVAVAQAKFADGTVWNNPAVPAGPPVSVIPGVAVSNEIY
jgi:hypothetical protein